MLDTSTKRSVPLTLDSAINNLYDQFCLGLLGRTEFLHCCRNMTIGGVSGLFVAKGLEPRYGRLPTIPYTDERIRPTYATYPSPGGSSGEMQGYLVVPEGQDTHPAVVLLHDNGGLNPYVEDVARRLAVAGFMVLAPDALYRHGGYPAKHDECLRLQQQLSPSQLKTDILNSAVFLSNHPLSNGSLGVVGLGWGGGLALELAAVMGDKLSAAVSFYGTASLIGATPLVRAPLLIHAADIDPNTNERWPALKRALAHTDRQYTRHRYPGTRREFHNNASRRFHRKYAALAEQRTIDFLRQHLC